MRISKYIHRSHSKSRFRFRHFIAIAGCFIASLSLTGQSFPYDIPTLPAGDSIIVSFDATVDNDIPLEVDKISCQVQILADGGINVLSDDPSTPESGDATMTALTQIPTMGEWGLILLGLLLVIVGTVAISNMESCFLCLRQRKQDS